MTTTHFNNLSEAEAERLAILIEEAAEVQQIACKILRHGYESKNPTLPMSPTNRQFLTTELGDLMCAIDLMVLAGDFPSAQVETQRNVKRVSIAKWMHHAPPPVAHTSVAPPSSSSCCSGRGCNHCEPRGNYHY